MVRIWLLLNGRDHRVRVLNLGGQVGRRGAEARVPLVALVPVVAQLDLPGLCFRFG